MSANSLGDVLQMSLPAEVREKLAELDLELSEGTCDYKNILFINNYYY